MSENAELSGLFLAALELNTDSERRQFLDRQCEDEQLREQVDLLLNTYEQADGFLSSPPPEFANTLVGNSDDEASPGHVSVLKLLGRTADVPQVVLNDSIADGIDPIVRPTSPEMPQHDVDSRYQLQGEIARGGMGAILKGRDVDLGRNLAVKVLLDSHKGKPEVIQRFIEEAQIGGQLQHPGIVPVYELGQFSDRRPFFSMKLVKGETLAKLLSKRKDPAEDRGRFLGIFEQVCQTMAYAHSRGVIHRDLKPANVMVGAFGEVQVMDWGLAKVLGSGGVADEQKAQQTRQGQSVIQTLRSVGSDIPGTAGGSGGSETQMGSVMGTPAYMPPEQALGEVDRLDERSDVFGLGAILCEILTGSPPYVGQDATDVFRQATRGKLDDCRQRLDACGADAELTAVAKQCLELEPVDRFENAEALTERISGYLESVETRLRETEVERAAEAARAVEERKRRKVTLALAASVLLMFSLAGGGWMWIQNQQTQRRVAAAEQVNGALNEARLHQALAGAGELAARLSELDQAVVSARQATEFSKQPDVDDSLREDAEALLAQLQEDAAAVRLQAEQADRDRRLQERLELIRLSHADGTTSIDVVEMEDNFDADSTYRSYQDAFRDAGLNLNQLDVDAAAKLVRESAISESLIAALDHWARTIPRSSRLALYSAWMAAGDWAQAAEVAREWVAEDPDNTLRPLSLAPMLILCDDHEGYRQLCEQTVQQFGNTDHWRESEHVAKVCLLLPDVFDVERIPSQVFEDALDDGDVATVLLNWVWGVRAMLAYRQGDPESALRYVEEALAADPNQNSRALIVAIQAMSEHALGNQQEGGEPPGQGQELAGFDLRETRVARPRRADRADPVP